MVYDHAVKAFGKIYFAWETVPEQEKQTILPPEQEDKPEMTVPESPDGAAEQPKETEQPPAPKRTSKAKGKTAC